MQPNKPQTTDYKGMHPHISETAWRVAGLGAAAVQQALNVEWNAAVEEAAKISEPGGGKNYPVQSAIGCCILRLKRKIK